MRAPFPNSGSMSDPRFLSSSLLDMGFPCFYFNWNCRVAVPGLVEMENLWSRSSQLAGVRDSWCAI